MPTSLPKFGFVLPSASFGFKSIDVKEAGWLQQLAMSPAIAAAVTMPDARSVAG